MPLPVPVPVLLYGWRFYVPLRSASDGANFIWPRHMLELRFRVRAIVTPWLRDLRHFCMGSLTVPRVTGSSGLEVERNHTTDPLPTRTTPYHTICPRSAAASFLLQFLISIFVHFEFIYCFIFTSIFSVIIIYYFCFFLCLCFHGLVWLALVYFDLLSRHFHGPGIEMMPAVLTEDSSNTPNLLIIAISLAAFGFLLVNAALVAWFFVHQRRKKGSLTCFSMFEFRFIFIWILFCYTCIYLFTCICLLLSESVANVNSTL